MKLHGHGDRRISVIIKLRNSMVLTMVTTLVFELNDQGDPMEFNRMSYRCFSIGTPTNYLGSTMPLINGSMSCRSYVVQY